MKRTYNLSGTELAVGLIAVSLVAAITAGFITSIRIRTSEQCAPQSDADFGIEPVRSAAHVTASVHPAPETLQ